MLIGKDGGGLQLIEWLFFFLKPGEESNWEGEEDTRGQERDFQQGYSEKKLIFQKNQIVLFPKRNLLPTEDKEDAEEKLENI